MMLAEVIPVKNFKRVLAGSAAAVAVFGVTAVQSFAATVDLPDAFSDLTPIIEFVLKLVEFLSKIFSIFN